jgi:APA family basic amino acid/polyamine antiporter
VAISAISLVKYSGEFALNVFPSSPQLSGFLTGEWSSKIIASAIILITAAIHIHGVKQGSKIQNFLTSFQIIIVLSLILGGIYFIDWSFTDRLHTFYPWGKDEKPAGIPVYGLALLIIMFSYSGWNAASYIAGEIHEPHRSLPRALFFGTLITACIYICINVVYLMSAPGTEVMGKDAIGAFTATKLFGTGISSFFTVSICVILLSSVSVQMMIGPRVTYAMATDKLIFKKLARISPRFHSPSIAITVQAALAIFYIFIGSASSLMAYMGFALSVFPLLSVIGVIYLRIKSPEIKRPFKVPLYPLIPLIFIILTIGMMIAGFLAWTSTSQFAIIVILAGIPVYYLWHKFILKK